MSLNRLFNSFLRETKVSFKQFIDDDDQLRRSMLVSVAGPQDGVDPLEVGSHMVLEDVEFVISTDAYAAGNVLTDVVEVPNFFPSPGALMWFNKFMLTDKDDETAFDIRIWLFDADVSLGAKNAAPSIADADLVHNIGRVEMPAADGVDVGGAKQYEGRFAPVLVKAAEGSTSLFIQLQVGTTGAPTFTNASDLVGKVGGFK